MLKIDGAALDADPHPGRHIRRDGERAVDLLEKRYPDIRFRVIDEQGRFRRHVRCVAHYVQTLDHAAFER